MFLASNMEDVPENLAVTLPGIFYLLSLLFSVFGESIYVARSASFVANALSAVLLLLIGKKLWSEREGMLASLLFLVAVLIPDFQAFQAVTEPFMVLFALLGVLFFLRSQEHSVYSQERSVYLILTGIAIALSLLFKWFAAFAVLGIVVFYLCEPWSRCKHTGECLMNSAKELLLMLLGFLIPIISVAGYFAATGALGYYIDDQIAGLMGYNYKLRWPMRHFQAYLIVWVFSGISVLAITYEFVAKRIRTKEFFIATWFMFSLLILLHPGFGKHLIPLLTVACLLASAPLISASSVLLRIRSVKNSLAQRDYVKIAAMVCMCIIILFLVVSTISVAVNHVQSYQRNKMSLLDDQVQTANYIQSHTEETEKIYVFPNGPEIHFLSGRYPPARFLWTHPVHVPDETAESDFIDRLEESNLKYIVSYHGHLTKPYFQHLTKYIRDNYQLETTIGPYYIYRKSLRLDSRGVHVPR